MYGTTQELRAAFADRSGLSDNERAAIDRQIRQAEADDVRKGTQMLADAGNALAAEHDEITTEANEVAEGFRMVAEVSRRPDADAKEVAAVYVELDKRARALQAWADSWATRAADHREKAKQPAQHLSDLRKRWAANAPTERERFLHHVSGL